MKVITADERMAEVRGPKILIAGPPGVGKTSLLRTLDVSRTLFFDLEAGDLAVKDVRVDQVRARSWAECRDVAVLLAGPNHALSPDRPYSQAHYDAMLSRHDDMRGFGDRYDTFFVDSITVASRLCLQWAQQQPEAFNREGKADPRGAYGLLGREMIAWMMHLQHAAAKTVIFVGLLEVEIDEFKRQSWQLQIEGKKAGRDIPGIVDEVIGMSLVAFGEGQAPTRALLCTPNAGAHYPGYLLKDRSGLLDPYEPPHLGALLAKLGVASAMEIAA